LNSAETNDDECKKIAKKFRLYYQILVMTFDSNPELFARVKAVYDSRESLKLSPEQVTLLDKKYKFSRNGANFTEDKKNKLREIDKELSKLSLHLANAFGNNALKHLTDEKTLPDYPKELSKPLSF
jgi:peptidyl-dipeptidase Dcp